ncbi:Unknown protein sequence [Pseudomonas amygdali pv. hibisci]|uniref:Uncharacterized protein n=2 Tax=Pseudomonas TaxID=286 RepID=A0AB34UC55_PSEA0|nr:Unknown protein sequence [Pseudomonas amygdali pv. hibisci]
MDYYLRLDTHCSKNLIYITKKHMAPERNWAVPPYTESRCKPQVEAPSIKGFELMKIVGRGAVFLALLMFSNWGVGAEVCVSVGNHKVSIDKEYFAFPPSLKGVDYWGRNVSKIKKDLTCEDQASEVTVHFKWPTMMPAGGASYFSNPSARDRISLTIRAMDTAPTDMGYLKDIYTSSATQVQKDSVQYDSKKSLFGYRGTHGVEKRPYSYFWANDEQGRPWFFMMCRPSPSGELSSCDGEYYRESMKALMILSIPGSCLDDWKKILEQANSFVESHVRY